MRCDIEANGLRESPVPEQRGKWVGSSWAGRGQCPRGLPSSRWTWCSKGESLEKRAATPYRGELLSSTVGMSGSVEGGDHRSC